MGAHHIDDIPGVQILNVRLGLAVLAHCFANEIPHIALQDKKYTINPHTQPCSFALEVPLLAVLGILLGVESL